MISLSLLLYIYINIYLHFFSVFFIFLELQNTPPPSVNLNHSFTGGSNPSGGAAAESLAVTMNQLGIPINELEFGKLIGNGTYGEGKKQNIRKKNILDLFFPKIFSDFFFLKIFLFFFPFLKIFRFFFFFFLQFTWELGVKTKLPSRN